MPESTGKYVINHKVYDFLNNAVKIYLPALATLYFSLAGIWGFPYGEQIIGTITAVTVFLGVCLKISKVSYDNSGQSKDGTFIVDGDGLKRVEIDATPDEIASKKTIRLAVKEDPQLPLS